MDAAGRKTTAPPGFPALIQVRGYGLVEEFRPLGLGQGIQGPRTQAGSARSRSRRMARTAARIRTDDAPTEAVRNTRSRVAKLATPPASRTSTTRRHAGSTARCPSHVDGLALVSKGGVARDHEGAANARQVARQALRDSIDEIFLLRVAADIGERQHDQRGARRRPDPLDRTAALGRNATVACRPRSFAANVSEGGIAAIRLSALAASRIVDGVEVTAPAAPPCEDLRAGSVCPPGHAL